METAQINIDLRPKADKELLEDISKFKPKLSTKHSKFKVGDLIQFNSGYNGDIRYTAEIFGFDSYNEIYLIWDCFWFPIKDDKYRNIEIVN